MTQQEIWKEYTGEVEAFRGHIMVSTYGRVLRQYDRWPYALVLKPPLDADGYPILTISINGKKYTKKVHRLIAETFCPNPENKPEVDHINAIRNDNRAENLRWVTKSENSRNPHHIKLISELLSGNSNPKKPVFAENKDGKRIEFDSINDLKNYFKTKGHDFIHEKLESEEYFTAYNSKLKGWKIGYIKNDY